MLTAVFHFEARQAEGCAEHQRPQIESSTEGIIGLEREDHPHETSEKQ